MPLDPAKLNLVAYGGEGFGTPLFPETLDAALAQTDLAPGDRVLDLGCGHGQMAHRYACRGLIVDAYERHLRVAEAARTRTADVGPGSVTVTVGEAVAVLQNVGGDYRLVSAVGAGRIAGAGAGHAEILRRLGGAAATGGWVLWGETFWREPPSPRLRLLGDITGAYAGHLDYVRAGVEADLVPMAALESSRREWDDYVFRYVGAIERFAVANPHDPDVPALLERGRAWRDLFLEEGRDLMGFGLYLFWKR